MMIRVYTASKLDKAAFWREFHATHPEVYCHARWLKHNLLGTPDSAEHATRFWVEDEQDVRTADVVVVYGTEGDKLRGALVEAGIAIACGVPVCVIGDHPDYGTWQYHPGVCHFANLQEFLSAAKRFCR